MIVKQNQTVSSLGDVLGARDKIRIVFTKKNIAAEPRRSSAAIDAHLKDLRDGVLTASRVSTFYHDHIDRQKTAGNPAMIMPRDATQILGQMRAQRVYICEERASNDDITIHAASMLWDEEYPVPLSSDPSGYAIERFLEIGTQVSELPGFNLQRVLTSVILLETLNLDPSGTVYAATYGDATASALNFTRNMGFKEWMDVPATLRRHRDHYLETGGETHRGVNWFRPTIESLHLSAELILELIANPTRRVSLRGNQDRSNSVREIEIQFNEAEFRRAPFHEIVALAKDFVKINPRTYEELQRMVGNKDLSRTFVDFGK